MRIAIDARSICGADGGVGAGVEHYAWSAVFALVRRQPEHRFFVFVPRALSAARRASLTAGCANVRLLPADPVRVPFVSRHLLFPLALKAVRADVLFVPTPNLPWAWGGPSVVVVHDLAIFDRPDWFPDADAQSVSTKRLVPRSLARATRIVAVSEATRRAVARFNPQAEEKTTVAYPGVPLEPETSDVAPSATPPLTRLALPPEYLLFLGTVEPRKNLTTVIYAFHRFLTDHPERAATLRFLLAGKWGWKAEDVREAMDRVNAWWQPAAGGPVVCFLGPVLEEEKRPLLRGASAFVFPSLDEGFGLPVLEAMAEGVPVICSDRGALPEVVGDAGLLCPPQDAEGLAFLYAQCLLMPEAVAYLREEGKRRAAQFTWERTADGILDALERTQKPA